MTFPRTPLVLLASVSAAIALAACGSSSSSVTATATSSASASSAPATGQRLVVVSTVAPITSMAANIIGDKADIVGVVPEGTNSHTFEPPPQIAATLEKADVVFVNGLQLEEPTFKLAEANKKPDTTIVKIGDRILPESEFIYDFSFPKEDGKPNPHLWTDPTFAMKYADVIAEEMSKKDPANAATYAANRDAFKAKVTELSEALKKDQAALPADKRVLLTYHDAYAYFAKNYDWTVLGAIQPSNFEDPQPKEIARLIDQVKEQQVPVIFGSEVFPSKVLEQIANETGARYESSLRDDDLPGAPGEPEHSWLGLMRYNYVTMLKGFGVEAPALKALDVADVTTDKADYPQ